MSGYIEFSRPKILGIRGASKVFLTALVMACSLFALSATSASAADVTCSHVNSNCYGTTNYDAIKGWQNDNYIYADAGRDDVWAKEGYDAIYGGDDGDNLNGGNNADNVYGQDGNDSYIYLGSGNSGLYGGFGNDKILGADGEDYVDGEDGNDDMYGGNNNDWLFAEDGEADIVGGGPSSGLQPCYVDGHDAYTSCSPQ